MPGGEFNAQVLQFKNQIQILENKINDVEMKNYTNHIIKDVLEFEQKIGLQIKTEELESYFPNIYDDDDVNQKIKKKIKKKSKRTKNDHKLSNLLASAIRLEYENHKTSNEYLITYESTLSLLGVRFPRQIDFEQKQIIDDQSINSDTASILSSSESKEMNDFIEDEQK